MNNLDRRKNLKALLDYPILASGFKDKESAYIWLDSVAPLLKFNGEYYANFMRNSRILRTRAFSNCMC